MSVHTSSAKTSNKNNSNNQKLTLTKNQKDELNNALEDLRKKANQKLAKNDENFTVSEKVNNKNISFSFYSEPTLERNGLVLAAASQRQKSYSATVKNTAGFNFSHRLYGTFLYGKGKVGKYTKHVDLSGPFYSKSASTHSKRIDSSVVEVSSNGKFKALKYAPVEYTTSIIVRLYGSGTYRILKLRGA
ncbi:hypothetical protein [Scopulibacillus daqui]|uniref:hypothetical protein n=1 Tax=Scopulibacillus daqui TaxID=1469162 RepID=UPI001961C079|nr:hypothetical protein [Scopulibacillus daqui]